MSATDGRLRLLVAAFGDPGHAYPAIALARALAQRGHRVVLESWERWREAAENAGLEFTAAEEYRTFPPPSPESPQGADAADAAKALAPLLEELRPHVLVSDILTLAPSLAAEAAGVTRATLVPHVYPVHERGLPFFAFGAQPPRTALGRAAWTRALPVLETGLRRGRRRSSTSNAHAWALLRWSASTAESAPTLRWSRPSPNSSTHAPGRPGPR